MGIPGLFPLLVMWGSLAPALLAPLQPICDSRVMDRFIQEASKAERDVGPFCNASCDLPAAVTGPDTKVNFQQWTAMPRAQQASEVWRGQALLSAAVGQLHVPDQLPAARAFLTTQLQAMGSTLRSVKEVLRSHNTEAVIGSREQDGGPASTPHLSIRTWRKLFSTYSGFLRGKVNLYITAACRVNAR